MKRDDLIYLAGFVDGEGCIFAAVHNTKTSLTRRKHFYPALHIAQKFPGILYWIQEEVGKGKVTQRSDKQSYTYKISGSNCSALLSELLPFLKGKRNQAELAIQLMQVPGDDREPIYRQLQLLKRKEGVTSE